MSKFGYFIWFVALVVTVSAVRPMTAQSTPPAASAPAPRRVPAAEQDKMLKKKVDPVYPKEAFDAKITGVVTLDVTIGTDGKVSNVAVRGKAEEVLAKAAMDAVKQWIYKPTVDKDTKMPVEVQTLVQLNFKVGE